MGSTPARTLTLLHDLLRRELKFDGWVMSDWGATHSTVDAANHGLDQEMPIGEHFGAPLEKAVEDGKVTVATIDEHVRNILVPMFRQGLFDRQQPGNWDSNVRTDAHTAFSRKAAEESTILLKNQSALLPLRADASVAVIGEAGSTKPKGEGGGSSEVVAPYIVSPFDGIGKRGKGKITSDDGARSRQSRRGRSRRGRGHRLRPHRKKTEGYDRPGLNLPGNQDALISAVAAANRKTIVVLDTGGPVLMPWIDRVAGVLEAWYSGQEDGNAIAAILYGAFNPSARLPLTFPRTAAEIPTASKAQWPGVNGRSLYSEGLNVGYRWYDATHTQPLFPFGFGLSYTTFRLNRLAVEPRELKSKSGAAPGVVLVKVDVTNTGARDGAEVVEAYVADPPKNGEPPHQLRGFAKVRLKVGETKSVTFTLDPRSFSIYDAPLHRWTCLPGTYEVLVGTSSRDLPLHGRITIR